MWWWLAPLLIIMAIAGYLLFAPFYLLIDSTIHFYGFRFHRLASARLVFADNTLNIDLVVATWRRRFNLLKKTSKRKPAASTPKKKRPGKKKFGLQQVTAILKTFEVKQFYLDADTGDSALNGVLYPVFYLAGRYTGKPLSINFSGNNIFILQVEDNLARIAKSIIYSYLKQKNHGKSE